MRRAVSYSGRDPDRTLWMQQQRCIPGFKPYSSGDCVQELVARVVVPCVLNVSFPIEEREGGFR